MSAVLVGLQRWESVMRFWRLVVLTCALGGAGMAWGQTAGPTGEDDDPMARPTEYGIRFTPTMARSMAGVMTREFFVNHHQLDAAKADKVTEMIARRLMQFAHQNDAVGQELAEFTFTEVFENVRENQGRGMNNGIPRRLAQGIGTRLSPIMPSVRELTNGVLADVRPELSFKEQLKLTAEVAGVNVALDIFEKNMQSWAKGEVDPYGNPFEDKTEEFKKDEKGETRAVRNARRIAEEAAKNKPGSEWRAYVEEAKKYYVLDPAQAEAADSLLREYEQRAEVAVGSLNEWRARQYRAELYMNLAWRLPGGWQNGPFRILMEQDRKTAAEPLDALGDELKARLDEIPTAAQREAADKRVQTALGEMGFKAEATAATAPAEEAAK